MHLPGQAYLYVLRSPHAHAFIKEINIKAAMSAPGVLAVLTGKDYLDDNLGAIPNFPNPQDRPLKNIDGKEVFETPIYPIVTDKIRRIGEAIAIIVANTLDQAQDAAELIETIYDPQPVMISPEEAMASGDTSIISSFFKLVASLLSNLNASAILSLSSIGLFRNSFLHCGLRLIFLNSW